MRLRAIFLDADTGKIAAALAWPTESRIAGIVTTYEGKFVAQTGNDLTLYHESREKVTKRSGRLSADSGRFMSMSTQSAAIKQDCFPPSKSDLGTSEISRDNQGHVTGDTDHRNDEQETHAKKQEIK